MEQKKYKISAIVGAMMLFSLLLFYQNCSKDGGSLNMPSTEGQTGGTIGTDITFIASNQANATTSVPGFSQANGDMVYFEIVNGTNQAWGCTAYSSNQSVIPTACDGQKNVAPYKQIATASGWVYNSAVDTWNYNLLATTMPVGLYKSCAYNPVTQLFNCRTYTVN